MGKNLVIVESPAKAKTIEKFLGKEYSVKSCNGHIVDLPSNKLSIKVEKNFEPEYKLMDEKKKLVKELAEIAGNSEMIWLATDEDREGEAISWHLFNELKLDKEKTRRIVFHEITKTAILEAIEHSRDININLVNAQQARRVLDRLVGYKISPILWAKVKPALSAGRVQSVALRLIVEREREIINFETTVFYKVVAEFFTKNNNRQLLKAELNKKFDSYAEARAFLESLTQAEFMVDSVEKKAVKKSPAPPFTTSTLQQEANRKLGFSVLQTMKIAQSLYESGHITYMRTDSVRLSNLALHSAKEEIIRKFGNEYSHTRNFTTKSKSAQEAHEAIRPTNFEHESAGKDNQEKRLYELIWKRAVASQMADAQVEKTTIKIKISNNSHYFSVSGEVITFDGFLKLYIESPDEDSSDENEQQLPPVQSKQPLQLNLAIATERFTRPPFRYSEATLVKKMEELGIGRPSTYAPTISTLLKRDYVNKDTKQGKDREYKILTLSNGKITEQKAIEQLGYEKGKLSPCSIGMIVNDFLVESFPEIMDYHFTASVEDEFDKIASGESEWQKMISAFYNNFEKTISKSYKTATANSGERELGIDPASGRKIFVKFGKFGPYVQLGEKNDGDNPRYVPLKKGQLLENITLEEALVLLQLPRELGLFENNMIIANIGKYGPYIAHNKAFYPIKGKADPYTITLDKAIEIIRTGRETKEKNHILTFDFDGKTAVILNGRYGPYISFEKDSYRIPKGTDPLKLNAAEASEILKEALTKKKTAAKKSK